MRWDDINGDTWHLSDTKSGRPHSVPLSDATTTVLDSLPRFSGPHIFSGTSGERPASGFSRAKRRLDELSGATGWRFHDIRRTVATRLAQAKVEPHILQRILNHSGGPISGVSAVYNRYAYEDEKRAALNTWASILLGVVEGTVSSIRKAV